MARFAFAAVLLSCTALTSHDVYAGFRLDVMGWDPFAQKTTGWSLGLEVFADRNEAERQQVIVEKWVIVKSARIVEVDESPPPVQLPPELNPTLPRLDGSGKPLSVTNSPQVTVAKYRDLIDDLYLNARDAKHWALNNPAQLNPLTFGKVNAVIEKYNDEISRANESPRAPYARVEPVTPQDLLAAMTRHLLRNQKTEHERVLKEIRNSLSKLKGERVRLLKRQSELDEERRQIAAEETEMLESFNTELNKIQQGFQEIDAILAKNPSRQEVKSQGLEERLKTLRSQKEKLEVDNEAAEIELKAKFESWKPDYELLAQKFNDFNERSRETKQRLSSHQALIEKSSDEFVRLRESVLSYFGTDTLDMQSPPSTREAIKRWLGSAQ